MGEVSRIGIRASVIRTADGSEVIVPNGSLISSQVTNWTFSDRQRAVELPVNVTGGATPTCGGTIEKYCRRSSRCSKRTLAASLRNELQCRCGNLSTPGLESQDHHEDWAQLRSNLSVAVNEALAREKIAIA